MNSVRFVAAVAVVASISACSSGSSTNTDPGGNGTPPPETTFPEYIALNDDLRAAIDGFVSTDPATLPDLGSTDYTGVVRANLDAVNGTGEDAAVGLLSMTVLWEDNEVSGTVTDIVDGDSNPYTGQLTLSNGLVTDRIRADIDGTIVNAASETLVVEGVMSGDFFSDIIFAEGGLSGTVTGPDGTTTLDGGWIASDR